MTYRMTAAIAADETFRARVAAALLDAAQDIANETSGGGQDQTEGGQTIDASWTASSRARLAYDCLADPTDAAGTMAWLCAGNQQVQSGGELDGDGVLSIDDSSGKADDAALGFIVASNWDRVARWRAEHPAA